jgi:hypothetical protein
MELSKDQINEVAELLDCGHLCFVNIVNGQVEYYPNDIDLFMDEEDPWKEIKDKIDNDLGNYIKCETMNSNQSFNVMKEFADSLIESEFRIQLENALERPKPFRNFNHLINDSTDFRQSWFDFKHKQYVFWVMKQLNELKG